MAKAPGRRLRGLRAAREARHLTQRALAERSGVTYSTVGNLETGRRAASRDTIEKLAGALDVAPDALTGGADTNAAVVTNDWPADPDTNDDGPWAHHVARTAPLTAAVASTPLRTTNARLRPFSPVRRTSNRHHPSRARAYARRLAKQAEHSLPRRRVTEWK